MDDLKVSLIQSDLYWENTDANLGMFEEKIWQISEEVDLILLPEMFTTGFTMNAESVAEPGNSKTFRWMKQQAAQTKAVIVGSYIIREKEGFFNRLFAVYPDGHFESYNKRHLFGLAGEDQKYLAGEDRVVIDVKGWKILPLICYDLRFPVWSRSRKKDEALNEYDLVLYVANWPKPRITAWDALLAARAIENNAYCLGINRMGEDGVGATYTGHSAVYDYLGECLAYSEKEEIINISLSSNGLRRYRKRFPFQADGDEFEIH